MEYQSNINHNSAAVIASNGATSSIASNPASSNENRKPVSAQQLVRENVQFLIQQLEAGHSEALTAFLDAMAHFHNYSFWERPRHRPTENSDIVLYLAGVNEYRGLRVLGDPMRKPCGSSDQFGRPRES
jgi:hypothetical protein